MDLNDLKCGTESRAIAPAPRSGDKWSFTLRLRRSALVLQCINARFSASMYQYFKSK